jgi:DNA-binding transcriptional MocR family regulator
MPAQRRAQAIALDFERRIRAGELTPGERLPTVRALAGELAVDPGTTAAAYRVLRTRGFVVSDGRRGTRVATQLEPRPSRPARLPQGVRDLASSAIDPELAPDVGAGLARLAGRRLDVLGYAENAKVDALVEHARAELGDLPLAFVGGTLDGMERVLQAHLRPGDRVGVEDPAFPRLLDLLHALGLRAVPVAVDDEGPEADALARALVQGLDALVLTPVGQNPFGSSLGAERAERLRELLRPHELLVVEDAHGGVAETLTAGRERWAIVRSLSELLGADFRLAFVAGDAQTIARVEARQAVTTSWVSRLLQELAAELLGSAAVRRQLRRAADETDRRRAALMTELKRRGVAAHGSSGLHVWVPVREEMFAVAHLLEAGYAVQAGERFRLRRPPAVRVTTARLEPDEAPSLADALAEAASGRTQIG